MHVRRIAPADKDAWQVLFQAYISFYETRVEPAVIDITFQRLVDGQIVGLVAVDAQDRPVGLAHAVIHPSTWSATGYCYLEDLFVAPDWRGRRVGRALIEAVYQEADARGCSRTYWVTQQHNAEARSLYDRLATLTSFVQYRR